MSKLWLFNNKLVSDAGKLIICETCPCAGAVPQYQCGFCPDGYLAGGFSFQISGMKNGTCSDCTDANATWNVNGIEFGGCSKFKHFLDPHFCGGPLGLVWEIHDAPTPGSATGTGGWYLELRIYYAYFLSYESIVYRTYQSDSVQCYDLFEEPMEYVRTDGDRGVCINHDSLNILVTAYNV